jgi:hypothetical protein
MDEKPVSAPTKVAIIAMTAVLYAIGKALTAYIPTPWGVGELLVGIFIPAFFAVVSDTWSVAIGAGLGTFIGDSLFLTATGSTNPALSLIAGVPSNFLAFLLFGWFVKKYKTWGGFVTATVSFVTLGNFIAGASIVLFGAQVFTPLGPLVKAYYAPALIFGFTAFWTLTMVPVIIIVVPVLVRAVAPLRGRSSIITSFPEWNKSGVRTPVIVSLLLAVVVVAIAILYLPGSVGLAGKLSVSADDAALGIIALLIVVPVTAEAALASRRPE